VGEVVRTGFSSKLSLLFLPFQIFSPLPEPRPIPSGKRLSFASVKPLEKGKMFAGIKD